MKCVARGVELLLRSREVGREDLTFCCWEVLGISVGWRASSEREAQLKLFFSLLRRATDLVFCSLEIFREEEQIPGSTAHRSLAISYSPEFMHPSLQNHSQLRVRLFFLSEGAVSIFGDIYLYIKKKKTIFL